MYGMMGTVPQAYGFDPFGGVVPPSGPAPSGVGGGGMSISHMGGPGDHSFTGMAEMMGDPSQGIAQRKAEAPFHMSPNDMYGGGID